MLRCGTGLIAFLILLCFGLTGCKTTDSGSSARGNGSVGYATRPLDDRGLARISRATEDDGPRLALVVGNSDYQVGPLRNPVNDARLVSTTLARLGFDVESLYDADQRSLKGAIRDFGKRLTQAGAEAVGLFFYAGHGLQVNGQNYLVPVNANIDTEADVDIEAVRADNVLRQMHYGQNKVNLLILDACRNNPYARSFRSPDRGLARMDAPRDTLIAYSTAPGKVAADGDGQHSPFTSALVQALSEPGLKVEETFKEVRRRVLASTAEKQVPWESSSLVGDFYFVPGEARPVARPQPAAVAAVPERPDPDQEACDRFMQAGTATAAETYLARFPSGRCAPTAENVIALSEQQVAQAPVVASRPTSRPSAVVRPEVQPAVGIYPDQGGSGRTWRDSVTGMEFVWVPGGTFEMGCGSWTSDCSNDEKPVHRVTLDGYWLGKYEVTQGQWHRVMGNNPSGFKNGDDHPVERVSWNDVQDFIRRLNSQSGATFRLPSEAEWEYACRSGGRPEKFSGSSSVGSVGWYDGNSGGKTHPVGGKSANGLGLHDMSGNVYEWVQDWYDSDAYSSHSSRNPIYSDGGSNRVVRGGSWLSFAGAARCAYRSYDSPGYRYSLLGFRLLRSS